MHCHFFCLGIFFWHIGNVNLEHKGNRRSTSIVLINCNVSQNAIRGLHGIWNVWQDLVWKGSKWWSRKYGFSLQVVCNRSRWILTDSKNSNLRKERQSMKCAHHGEQGKICACRCGQSLTRLLFNNSFEASRDVLVPIKFDIMHNHKPECTTVVLNTRKWTLRQRLVVKFPVGCSESTRSLC